jgi:signal transduction histidine kinase
MPPVTKLLADLQKTGKYKTFIEQDENLPALGNDKPIILFRMIQEVINNIIRHAAADTIHLDAKKKNDNLIITIEDNGKGFDSGRNSGGVGLQNLKNRSKMINADLLIKSEQGKGTLVTISIKTDSND